MWISFNVQLFYFGADYWAYLISTLNSSTRIWHNFYLNCGLERVKLLYKNKHLKG